jgi:hypothetical protein
MCSIGFTQYRNNVELPVLDNYARESFDINRENARVFCSPGFYLRNTTSLRKKETMAMLRRFTDSDYPFGIFKLFLDKNDHCQ